MYSGCLCVICSGATVFLGKPTLIQGLTVLISVSEMHSGEIALGSVACGCSTVTINYLGNKGRMGSRNSSGRSKIRMECQVAAETTGNCFTFPKGKEEGIKK